MTAFGDYLEQGLVDYFFRNSSAPARPATMYVAALTALAGDTPTEVAVGGYARQPAVTGASSAWAAAGASGGGYATENSNALETGPFAASATVVGIGIYDAVSGGNLYFAGYLSTERRAFTMNDAGTDVFVCPGHNFANGDRIVLRADGDSALPTGASADVLYYVINTNAGAGTFQLSATAGGASLALTAVGSGMALRVVPRDVGAGDYFRLPAGALDVILR